MKKNKSIYNIFIKPTKKQIAQTVQEGYVIFHNIKWDTDGQKINLPKAVAVPKENFEPEFDFAMEGADFLSDLHGWCVQGFSFDK